MALVYHEIIISVNLLYVTIQNMFWRRKKACVTVALLHFYLATVALLTFADHELSYCIGLSVQFSWPGNALLLILILLQSSHLSTKSTEGTRWCSCLRHYATSQKVAGSSPNKVDFFNLPNPSRQTMALGSTQLLTEMSNRNLPVG
jgi:hypothetical protein